MQTSQFMEAFLMSFKNLTEICSEHTALPLTLRHSTVGKNPNVWLISKKFPEILIYTVNFAILADLQFFAKNVFPTSQNMGIDKIF